MGVVLAWLRLELPRRWRSLVMLALLIPIASGTVLAAARRAGTVVDRLLDVTRPAHVRVTPFESHFDWAAVRALPQVEALARYADNTLFIDGISDKTVGPFTPAEGDMIWQCRGVVVTHATVIAVIGLLFGMPLGLALGRTVWWWIASSTPVFYVPPVAFWALVLVAPVVLLMASSLAAWLPGCEPERYCGRSENHGPAA